MPAGSSLVLQALRDSYLIRETQNFDSMYAVGPGQEGPVDFNRARAVPIAARFHSQRLGISLKTEA
jgi:hypothetical protein